MFLPACKRPKSKKLKELYYVTNFGGVKVCYGQGRLQIQNDALRESNPPIDAQLDRGCCELSFCLKYTLAFGSKRFHLIIVFFDAGF